MAALAAIVGPEGSGWSMEVAGLGLSGTALIFGMWWSYFIVPSGEFLHGWRHRAFGWGYGHMVLFAALVAVGAGLHVAAYALEHHCALSSAQVVLVTAVPLGVFLLALYGLYSVLTREYDPRHTGLLLASLVPLVGAPVLAHVGVSLPWCLFVLALTPWITVVGYERFGHEHNAKMIERARAAAHH